VDVVTSPMGLFPLGQKVVFSTEWWPPIPSIRRNGLSNLLEKLALFVAGITQWTTRRRLGVLVICGDVGPMTAGHMSWVVYIGHCLPCKVRSEVRIWGKLDCPRACSYVSACSIELCRSLLGYILFYGVDEVHELSVRCAQGTPGINVILNLFASFRLFYVTLTMRLELYE
jgi:hypothetical protein